MPDKTTKYGVMPYDQFKERTLKIAKGEYKPGADEPKIWFESLNAAAQNPVNEPDEYDLPSLVEKITDENLHAEIDTGKPVGNETC
jgi:predicted transcriptional regulator